MYLPHGLPKGYQYALLSPKYESTLSSVQAVLCLVLFICASLLGKEEKERGQEGGKDGWGAGGWNPHDLVTDAA